MLCRFLGGSELLEVEGHVVTHLLEEVLDVAVLTVLGPGAGEHHQVSSFQIPKTCLIAVTEVDARLHYGVNVLLEGVGHTVVPHRSGYQDDIHVIN